MPAKRKGPAAAALARFHTDFTKSFGDGALIRPTRKPYRVVSTGSLTLDEAMGCGGYVVGRIVEIWGPESVAKTTMAMIAAANFQREFPDRLIGWIDMEHTFDWDWAKAHDIDPDLVELARPESAEDVSDMAKKMLDSKLFSLIVLDSVGGMITEEEMDKEAKKASVGTAAKVVTRMVKQGAVLCDKYETTMIIINQVRANLSYGGDTTTGGGFALKHVTTHKIRLRRTGDDPFEVPLPGEKNKNQVGFKIAAHVEKNKVAPPRRVAEFGLMNQDTDDFGPIGIDRASEALTIGLRSGVIGHPTAPSYTLPDREKPIVGQKKVLKALRENPDLVEQIRKASLEAQKDQVSTVAPDPEEGLDELAVDDEVDDDDFATGGGEVDLDPELIEQARNPEAISA